MGYSAYSGIFPMAFNLSPNSHHNVFCFSPHSLHVYGTRTCPGSAETRFGAPHFPHFVSMRVCPCLTVTVFRSKASFTKRSVSSRIACFDISRLFLLAAQLSSQWAQPLCRPAPSPSRHSITDPMPSSLNPAQPFHHRND